MRNAIVIARTMEFPPLNLLRSIAEGIVALNFCDTGYIRFRSLSIPVTAFGGTINPCWDTLLPGCLPLEQSVIILFGGKSHLVYMVCLFTVRAKNLVLELCRIARSAMLKVGNFDMAVRAYQHLRPNDISDCSCCPSRVCHFI